MKILIYTRIHSLLSFIWEMKHLSISQWDVEAKELSYSKQTLRQQKVVR